MQCSYARVVAAAESVLFVDASEKCRKLEGQNCLPAGEATPLFQHLRGREFILLPKLLLPSHYLSGYFLYGVPRKP